MNIQNQASELKQYLDHLELNFIFKNDKLNNLVNLIYALAKRILKQLKTATKEQLMLYKRVLDELAGFVIAKNNTYNFGVDLKSYTENKKNPFFDGTFSLCQDKYGDIYQIFNISFLKLKNSLLMYNEIIAYKKSVKEYFKNVTYVHTNFLSKFIKYLKTSNLPFNKAILTDFFISSIQKEVQKMYCKKYLRNKKLNIYHIN